MKIGELLVNEGKLSRAKLEEALRIKGQLAGRIGTSLLELGAVDENALLEALGRQRSTRTVSRADLVGIPSEVIRMIPAKLATRYGVVPYQLRGRTLFVASRDIGDALTEDEIGFLTSCMVRTCLALEVRVFEALHRYYRFSSPTRHQALAQRLAARKQGPQGAVPARAQGSVAEAQGSGSINETSPASDSQLDPRFTAASDTAAPWKNPLQSESAGIDSPHAGTPFAQSLRRESRTRPPRIDTKTTQVRQAVPPPLRSGSPREGSRGVAAQSSAPQASVTAAPIAKSEPQRFIELDAEDAALLGGSAALEKPDLAPEPDEPVILQPAPLPWLKRRQVANGVPESETNSELDSGSAGSTGAPDTEALDRSAQTDDPIVTAARVTALEMPPEIRTIPREGTPEERLRFATKVLQDAEIRDDIADAMLEYAEPYLRRRLMLIARNDHLAGWRGEGEGVDPENVRAIEIGDHEPSVFLGLRGADSFWLGALPNLPPNAILIHGLGGSTFPRDCLVLPVALRSRVVCYLYGDNLGESVVGAPLPELRRLAAKAGLAFEVYLLKNKIRLQ